MRHFLPSKSVIFSIMLIVASGSLLGIRQAMAHGAERGLVMLLPTGFYVVGAMCAVALSFAVLTSATISRWIDRMFRARLPLWSFGASAPILPSLVATILLFSAIYCGFYGSPDPLSNILPLGIWTGWWVGFTLIQVVTGDLWKWLNPWSGLVALIDRLTNARFGKAGLTALPRSVGYVPAIILFFGFAWFELISIAPEDPERLALAVSFYWLFNFAGILLFGLNDWMERAEPFAVFFRLIGSFSPLAREQVDGRMKLSIRMPGAALIDAAPLPFSGICLVLLILGAASFDGLAETFSWMGIWGINPLEYEGRSSTQLINTLGILTTAAALGAAYFASLAIGQKLTRNGNLRIFAGRVIYSIIPISIAFHSAHYLTLMLINGQYLLKALSDPLGRGWDIFGTADLHVTASMVQNIDSVWYIWASQVAIITIGHMAGIVLAHMIAMNWYHSHAKAAISQLALAALMVFYTVFGLWLLSTPTIG